MNDYEGLNLPQLLDLMHDLVPPEPVPLVPQTVGWLIAVVWIIAIVTISGRHGYQAWRRNRYRREALTMLRWIDENSDDNRQVAEQVATLLKRTALAAYPREQVAKLYGAAWAQFLRETASNDPEVGQAADQLATAAYRPAVDGARLIGPARRWIKVHRA